MYGIQNKKMEKGKLLAAFVVIAMAVCCFAVMAPSVDAADATSTPLPEAVEGVITIDTDGNYVLSDNVDGRIVVNEGVTATIDLAGYTISYNNTTGTATEDNSNASGATIQINGTLTINDSSEKATGAVIQAGANAAPAVHIAVGGTLTINGGSFECTSESAYYVIKNLGTVTINDGVFENNSGKDSGTSGSSTIANGWWDGANNTTEADAVMTINGGTFNGAHYIKNDDYGVMNIYGGTFSETARGAAIMNVNKLVIDDDADDTQELIINGGDGNAAVLNWSIPGNEFDSGELAIRSGTFNVAALVGITSTSDPFGTVTINSGLGVNAIGVSNGTILTGTLTVGTETFNFDNYEVRANTFVSDAGKLTIDGPSEFFPAMKDETLFHYQGDDYIVYTYTYRGVDYQYGLAVHSIEYDGTDIMDSELSIIPIALPVESEGKLAFSNTDSKWYDKINGTYEGALKSQNDDGDAPGSTGLYTGVIRFSASIDSVEAAADVAFKGNTLTKYLNLNITPGQYTGEITIEGWVEGQYDESVNGPSIVVSTAAGDEVPADQYEVTYEYFTDAACTKSAGTDPSALVAGDYYVKATVTPANPNFDVSVKPVFFTVGVDTLASEIVFHPLQDLEDDVKEEAILGINPDKIQNIAFNTEDGTKYTVNGTVYNTEFDAESPIIGLDKLGIGIPGSGYFIAFYVEGVGFDITSIPAEGEAITDYITLALNGTDSADNAIAEITPEENDTAFRYYLMYIADIGADDETVEEPVPGQDGFDYTVDFDKEAGERYESTEYTVDVSYLNFYMIILNDDNVDMEDGENYYNDELHYYRADGAHFTVPSGAGDGFQYWNTEAGSTNDRVFEFGSIMVVGAQYDPDNDGIINLYAHYGETGTQEPTEPTVESTNILVSVVSTETGVDVYLIALDGGYIPAGTITVEYTYTYYDDFFGAYATDSATADITVDQSTGSIVIMSLDMTGFEHYSEITYVEAAFGSFESEQIVYTPAAAEAQ